MTTILVVDDSEMDCRIAGGLLEREPDCQVLYAADGSAALKSVDENLPDIVVTDMVMPNIDGLQLVEAMKRDYPLIPVIIMTAVGSEEHAVQALKRGAASYVPKRRLAQDLLETVRLVLRASDDDRNVSRLLVHRTQQADFKFTLENELPLLAAVVTYMQQTMRAMGLFDEAERLRIGVALEEVLLNAMFHGNLELSSKLREDDKPSYHETARLRMKESPYRDRRISFGALLSPAGAQFTIHDEGPGFNPKELPDPTDPANLHRVSGRGLLLMHTFMDEVSFNDSGNEVRLTKSARRVNVPPLA
jgi:CheY-like chemotaxis protein/anti-sigma regulatory factor (Ser/Thr protein kinase)